MATAPNRKGTYTFPVGGAGGDMHDVEVSWAVSGSGKIALSPLTPQKDVMIGDLPHPYNDKYVLVSKQALGDVRFTYTAAGSLPKGTTFKITMAGDGFTLGTRPDDDSTASVSGHGGPKIEAEGRQRLR